MIFFLNFSVFEFFLPLFVCFVVCVFFPTSYPNKNLLYLDFFSGTGHNSEPVIFNGLIGSSPRNPLVKELICNIKVNENDNNSIMNSTGPYYFQDIFFQNIPSNTVIFPTTFFYSFPLVERYSIRNQLNIKLINSYIKDESYCVHLWYTSWQK